MIRSDQIRSDQIRSCIIEILKSRTLTPLELLAGVQCRILSDMVRDGEVQVGDEGWRDRKIEI